MGEKGKRDKKKKKARVRGTKSIPQARGGRRSKDPTGPTIDRGVEIRVFSNIRASPSRTPKKDERKARRGNGKKRCTTLKNLYSAEEKEIKRKKNISAA